MSELGPTLEDLHAEIGRTLVVWGWLEGEMIDAGVNWRRPSPDAETDSLKTFLHELVEPRGVRNAIAHGLASAHGNPWKPEVEPDHPNYPWIYANSSGWMDSYRYT